LDGDERLIRQHDNDGIHVLISDSIAATLVEAVVTIGGQLLNTSIESFARPVALLVAHFSIVFGIVAQIVVSSGGTPFV